MKDKKRKKIPMKKMKNKILIEECSGEKEEDDSITERRRR